MGWLKFSRMFQEIQKIKNCFLKILQHIYIFSILRYEHQFQKYKKQFHNASKNIMNYHMHQSIGRKRTSYERANLHRFIYGNHQVLPITGKFHSMSDRQLISSIEFGPQNVLVAIGK